jgi:Starch-binding associating with outer membrane
MILKTYCMNHTLVKNILVMISVTMLGACTKQLNTNSNDPNGVGINSLTGKDIFAQALVATVTNKTAANISTASDNYDYVQCWMGYWARNTDWAASGTQAQVENFQLPTSFSNGTWQSLYHNIYDYNYVIGNSTANSVLPGASKIMRAMVFQDLVDQFGNIPYSQAGIASITTPKYDSATVIYKDLIVQIDSAILSLQASQATGDDASDVMFQGNKALWIQLANTLKLRILLRQVPGVYAANDPYINTELSSAISNGGFMGPGQDALVNPGFKDATQAQSPFWGVFGFQPGGSPGPPAVGTYYQNYNFFCANVTMLNFLDSTADPRLPQIYGLNASGGYGGNVLGSSNNSVSNTSPIGPGILQSASMSAWLITASQSLFMQAEAAQRGMIPGNANSLYKEAQEESFRYLKVPNAIAAADQFITGSSNSLVNIGSSSNPLMTILYQKWVADCELDPLEAFSDYRRTGYPVFNFITSSVPPGTPMPVRLLYPQSEYTQNAANLQANLGTSVQPASAIYEKIFWQP